MKKQKGLSKLLGACSLMLVAALAMQPAAAGSCGSGHASNLVETAAQAGSFNTLIAAVKAAGLVDALQGEGPLTVFAPTDEAFAKLPEGTIDSLLKSENKDQLTAILTYHVVAGAIYSSDAKPGLVETLQGSKLRVSESNGNLMIDGATVVSADISASNGVIHVIDQVIMPGHNEMAKNSR